MPFTSRAARQEGFSQRTVAQAIDGAVIPIPNAKAKAEAKNGLHSDFK
jgi:hypothetical protein